MLDHVRIIRNGGSHSAAEAYAISAYKSIGLSYPVTNWASAWDAVRNHTVEALDMLREEVAHLADADGDPGST